MGLSSTPPSPTSFMPAPTSAGRIAGTPPPARGYPCSIGSARPSRTISGWRASVSTRRIPPASTWPSELTPNRPETALSWCPPIRATRSRPCPYPSRWAAMTTAATPASALRSTPTSAALCTSAPASTASGRAPITAPTGARFRASRSRGTPAETASASSSWISSRRAAPPAAPPRSSTWAFRTR